MNAPPTSERVQWRGAIIGAVLFFALSVLLRYYGLTYPPGLLWLGSAFALAGALVGHLGMRTTSSIVGPVLGMALGLFVGAIIGDQVGGLIPMPESEHGIPLAGEVMNIAGTALDGQSFDLKQWRGKVVLVDFWATWCPPCLEELPVVQNAYARFHKDGLEIVGVSLDESKDKLAKFVTEHEMPWPQMFFQDQPRWENPLVRKYDIKGIPTMFLLDREGQITPVDLSREPLIGAIERYLGAYTPIFPMGLLIGACIGGFVGLRSGDFLQNLVRRKPARIEAK